MPHILNNLDLTILRQANRMRIPQFKNAKGQASNTKSDGSDWSLAEWVNATLGELGETSNLLKKIRRGDFSLDYIKTELGKELADVISYLDILAMQLDVSLTCTPAQDITLLKQDNVILKIIINFGLASEIIQKIETIKEYGQFVNNDDMNLFRHELRQYFHQIVLGLQELAFIFNINLGQATIDKFNEVSNRVGSTIFLHSNFYEDISKNG